LTFTTGVVVRSSASTNDRVQHVINLQARKRPILTANIF
jgi:hypothetical protein